MQINPDGKAVGGLSTFLAFIALNLLYLVTCLPLVTIGAATSALYEVTIRYSDDESGRPVADFYPAFARNFWRATLLSLILLPAAVVLTFSGIFWLSAPEPLLTGFAIFAFLAAAYSLAAFLHAMALVAAFRNTFRGTLKNALLLPAAEPMRTMGIVIIPVTAASLMILFPPFALITLTIGFSVGAYVSAFLFRSIYARHQS